MYQGLVALLKLKCMEKIKPANKLIGFVTERHYFLVWGVFFNKNSEDDFLM